MAQRYAWPDKAGPAVTAASQAIFICTFDFGRIRLKFGEWAVFSGFMTADQARTLSGYVGAANIPVLGYLMSKTTNQKSNGEALVVIKPHLLSPPPSDRVTHEIFAGTESRIRTPL